MMTVMSHGGDPIVSLRNRTAKRLYVTNVTGYYNIICMCRRDLYLTSLFSGLLQKDLFKGGLSLAESFFKQNYCHACQTRFAVSFPPTSFCVSSLIIHQNRLLHTSH